MPATVTVSRKPARSASPGGSENEDSEYEKPLQHKRPFGAGIKRKRVEFVPQSRPEEDSIRAPKKPTGDFYLSIVLPQQTIGRSGSRTTARPAATNHDRIEGTSTAEPTGDREEVEASESQQSPLCPICHLPTSASITSNVHTSSLAHQVCLPHSHPPSALDRQRKGLSYLSSYGWDPDARIGLGAQGDGRLYPVQAKEKEGKLGIGAQKEAVKEELKKQQEGKKARLKREKEEKQRTEKMKMLLYGRNEVNEHLGVRL